MIIMTLQLDNIRH